MPKCAQYLSNSVLVGEAQNNWAQEPLAKIRLLWDSLSALETGQDDLGARIGLDDKEWCLVFEMREREEGEREREKT